LKQQEENKLDKLPEKLEEHLHELGEESKVALLDYILTVGITIDDGFIVFFSYGSNMNEEDFEKEMREAKRTLNSTLDESRLKLIKPRKRVLEGFKRTLGNRSIYHGAAFSICPDANSRVEGICHDIYISSLPVFLKKEAMLSKNPNYRIIKTEVKDENQSVLTLLGVKPKRLMDIEEKDRPKALDYVKKSIDGAERFSVDHSDMDKVANYLSGKKAVSLNQRHKLPRNKRGSK